MKAMETSNAETASPNSEGPEPQPTETQTDERTEICGPELRDLEEMPNVLWEDQNRCLNDQSLCPQGRAWYSEPSTPRGERKGHFCSVASLPTEKLFELILNSQRAESSQTKPTALSDCLPQQPGQQLSPAEGEVVPAEGEVVSAEGEEVPAEGEEVPAEREVVPAEGEKIPAEGEEVPAEGEKIPSETGAEPTEKEEVPAEGKEIPAEGVEVPAEGGEVPEGVGIPSETGAEPAVGEEVPAEIGMEKAEGEEVPMDSEDVPAKGEKVPAEDKTVPAEGDAVPKDGEVDPTERAVPALRGVFPAEKAEPDDELYNTIMTHQSASARIEDQRSRRPAREEFFDLLERVQEGRMDEQRSVLRSRPQPKAEPLPQISQRARQPSLLLPLLRGMSQRRTNSS